MKTSTPNTLESDIQRQVCDYLALKHHFFWRGNNTPIYDSANKRFRAMPKYAPQGLPDIQIITDGGFTVFLEIKRKGGKQSDNQKEFEQKCKDKGAEYYLITDLKQVIELGL